MAYYQTGICSTANQFLIDFATFLEANGWTLDYNGVYATSYRRIHFHKGEAHFDIYSTSGTASSAYGCTGYSSGSAPNAQPGVTGSAKAFNVINAAVYWFVSTVGGIYIGLGEYGTTINWGAFFVVQAKIGAWSNGFGVQGVNALFLGVSAYNSNAGSAQIYYNGEWSGSNTSTKGLCGNVVSTDIARNESPNFYNGGINPFPTVIFIRNAIDTSKWHPIGYAPGLYRTNGGDIYDVGEIITIGSDQYIILPSSALTIGASTGNGDWLFKLGA